MHVWPVRTCVACRRRRPANELLRIARTVDGPRLDLLRRLEGRGCHVCPTRTCVERLGNRDGKSLRRALRCDPTDDLTAALAALQAAVELQNEEHQ